MSPEVAVADSRAHPALSRLPTLTEVVLEGKPPPAPPAPIVPPAPIAPGVAPVWPAGTVTPSDDAAAHSLARGFDRNSLAGSALAPGRTFDPGAEDAPQTLPALDPAEEARIVDAVVGSLQPRIDLMLEYRLREALTPVLARAADAIVKEARGELAQTLRDVATRAVAQELARRRTR